MNAERITNVNQKKLLDSFALLAYLNHERGCEKVRQALSKAQEAGTSLLMNEINIGKVYYILCRKRGEEKARYCLETIFPFLR